MGIRDLSTEDLLNSLGLEHRRTAVDYVFPALGIFGAGLLVGAGLGLLFAPKTGSEIRTSIGQRVRRIRKRGKDEVIEAEEASDDGEEAAAE